MFIRERTRFRIPPLNAKKSPAVAELFAEREGFEPPVPLGTVVFKTTVIDHSTISPRFRRDKNAAEIPMSEHIG